MLHSLLDEFLFSKLNAALTFESEQAAHRMPAGHYFASFQGPNYEALKSPSGHGARTDTVGLLEESDEKVHLLPRRQLPRVEEPGDDDDNVTFGPHIGSGLARNQFEASPRANPRANPRVEEPGDDDDNVTFGPHIGFGLPRNQFEANPRGLRTMEETPEDRGESSITAFSVAPRNALFAELELQTEFVNRLQARMQRLS